MSDEPKGTKLGKLTTGPFAGKDAYLASQQLVVRYADELTRILDAIGQPRALVTDMSSLSDFDLEPLEVALAEEELGIRFESDKELLVDIAARMRGVS